MKKKKKDTNKSRRTQTTASSSHGMLALIFPQSVLLTRILHSFGRRFGQSQINNLELEIKGSRSRSSSSLRERTLQHKWHWQPKQIQTSEDSAPVHIKSQPSTGSDHLNKNDELSCFYYVNAQIFVLISELWRRRKTILIYDDFKGD